jgi:hypothetical protein
MPGAQGKRPNGKKLRVTSRSVDLSADERGQLVGGRAVCCAGLLLAEEPSGSPEVGLDALAGRGQQIGGQFGIQVGGLSAQLRGPFEDCTSTDSRPAPTGSNPAGGTDSTAGKGAFRGCR